MKNSTDIHKKLWQWNCQVLKILWNQVNYIETKENIYKKSRITLKSATIQACFFLYHSTDL